MNKKQAMPWDNPRFKNWVAVARACQVMGQALTRALQGLDLKPPHLDILVNIYKSPAISQQDLARKMLVGRSNLSMLLPQLEQRGLVTRRIDPQDRRILRLSLTDAGMALTEEALVIHTEVIERSMRLSTEEECNLIGEAMMRIVKELTVTGPTDEAED
jgi:DNA-binding MarR family transcriptional regulator